MSNLQQRDLQMFERLLIPAELLERAHIVRVDAYEAEFNFGTHIDCDGGICYPYYPPTNGQPARRWTARIRQDNPPRDAKGKIDRKYVAPTGDNRHLYFAPCDPAWLADQHTPVIFVEAEKSALAILARCEYHRRPMIPIALGGCWNWRGVIGKTVTADGERVDEKGALPDLVVASGRRAYVLYDANCLSNNAVYIAREKFVAELSKISASVRTIDLPASPRWNGPDDFIEQRGGVEFFDLFEQAVERKLAASSGYQIQPVADLLAKDFGPEKFVLEGILPAGGTSILAAKPKVGKTTWSRQLLVSVAQRGRFLERDTLAGPVVLLAFQGRERDIQKHLRLLGAKPDDPIFYHCGRAPQGAVEKLYEMAKQHGPVLIVVEMLQHLIRAKDTNAYGEITLALEPVEDVARQSGTHIMMSTHLGKIDRSDPMDMIIGSTSFRGSVDTSILLRRNADDTRTIQTEQRVGKDLPETLLKWNEEQQCVYLGEARGPLERSNDEEKLLAILRQSGVPMTRPEIGAACTMTKTKVCEVLERIEKYKGKRLLRTGTGVKGNPLRFAFNPEPEWE